MKKNRSVVGPVIFAIVFLVAIGFIIFGKLKNSLYVNQIKEQITQKDLEFIENGGFTIELPTAEESEAFRVEQEERMRSVSSDIIGWSMYDKALAGLNTEDGSDTDHDGLSDKEEIEIYGSDPLLDSTSGDLYSDSYKVENGMDLFTTYEYQNDLVYMNPTVDDIVFNNLSVWNFRNAKSSDTENVISLNDDLVIYKEYIVSSYEGTINIDVKDVLSRNGISIDDVSVAVVDFYGNEYPEIFDAIKVAPSIITIDKEFKVSNINYVIVINKDYISDENSNDFINLTDVSFACDDDEIHSAYHYVSSSGATYDSTSRSDFSGDAFIQAWTLAAAFGGDIGFYYVSCGDEEQDRIMLEKMIYGYRKVTPKLTIDDAIELDSIVELEAKRWFYNSVMASFAIENPETYKENFNSYIEVHMNYDAVRDSNYFGDNYEQKVFNPYENRLPFDNFKSYIGTTGNCAGIAYYTANMFNNGSMPVSGKYYISDEIGMVDWDISAYENRALVEGDLYDYQYASYVDDHIDENGLLADGLTEAQWNFVDMIGCYWRQGNNIPINQYVRYANQDLGLDFDLIREIERRIDDGEMLILFMIKRSENDANLGGHAVNIIGYKIEEDENGNDVHILYVYDNNYTVVESAYVNNEIIIEHDTLNNTYSDNFFYTYQPTENYVGTYTNKDLQPGQDGYKVNSNLYLFLVLDDDWNILNKELITPVDEHD